MESDVWDSGVANRVDLYSRNQKLLNSKYPELIEALRKQRVASFIVDGEIAALQDGISSFARPQQRMQIQEPSAELRKRVPVLFYAFDLLFLYSYDLRQVPLRYRKELLAAALDFKQPLCFTGHRETEGEAFYREACQQHWEGVIGKDGAGGYVSGRSRQWLKFKCVHEQEFVIAGYTDPQGRRVAFVALLVGYYDRGKLKYAGRVGTGYDTVTLLRLGKQLARLQTESRPFEGGRVSSKAVHWVKPKLVAQIGFTEWTGEGKLRHPRFLGLRDDIKAQEVTREK